MLSLLFTILVVSGAPSFVCGGLRIDGRVYVLDQGESRCLIYGEDGRVDNVFSKEGQGPGELFKPDSILREGSRIWLGGRAQRRFQAFDLFGHYADETILLPLGTPIWIDQEWVIISGVGPGEKMVHWFNRSSKSIERSICKASKQNMLHNFVNGNFLAVKTGIGIVFGDSMELDVWLYHNNGRKAIRMNQSWAGISTTEKNTKFGGTSPYEFITSLDKFRLGSNFVAGSGDRLVVTWEVTNWDTDFIVQVFDIYTGELLHRADTNLIPVCSSDLDIFTWDPEAEVLGPSITIPY